MHTKLHNPPPPGSHNIPIHPNTIIHTALFMLLASTHTGNVFTTLKNTYPGYITFPTNMNGWGSAPSDACRNWKPKNTKVKAPGRANIFPKRTAATFPEEGCPKKTCNEKGTLFNLSPMGIINVIEMWIVGLEKSIKIKAIVTQINSQ